ncbi:hypothetical protein CN692_10700 [Bacillus sp. AFS002410]|uniref:hypothetical protein n=1 Tax=Bacillus sp. AFS002410 TaxID=2033481 RepID=UPI000BEFA6D6|nr:hypothetical protein [Bacillus sp. AFS002410]PEJ57955.1 hypothetical protein CN692_10700 [Bacillus sp. AFS002410]
MKVPFNFSTSIIKDEYAMTDKVFMVICKNLVFIFHANSVDEASRYITSNYIDPINSHVAIIDVTNSILGLMINKESADKIVWNIRRY